MRESEFIYENYMECYIVIVVIQDEKEEQVTAWSRSDVLHDLLDKLQPFYTPLYKSQRGVEVIPHSGRQIRH